MVLKPPSIKFKLVSAFLFMVFAVIAVFTVFFYTHEREMIRNEMIKRGHDVIKTFTQMTVPLFFSMDFVTILDNARELVQDSDILAISVIDKKGKILIHTDDNAPQTVEIDSFLEHTITSQTIAYRELHTAGTSLMEFVSPIVYFDKTTGLIRMQISFHTLEEKLIHRSYGIVILSLTLALIAVVLAVLLARLVNPVKVLVHGTKEISSGNLGYQIPVLARDEIGELARHFNWMSESLKSYAQSMAQKVAERTAALEQANQDLQNAKEAANAAAWAKSEFLANMSHEIRTPMNGVIAAADLALEEQNSPKVRRYLNIIQSSGYSLLGIINDILDFSKIEAGKLDLENTAFRVDDLLDKTANLFVNKLAEKSIRLHIDLDFDAPMALLGDPLRLQQIFTNLLANAIKFTDPGGMVIIGLKGFEPKGDRVALTFYVKDTGIGMKPEALANLFTPFSQADASTTRKYGGTGLGLAICKQLVELMGGRIWAESEYGKGACFGFQVLLQKPAQSQPPRYRAPQKLGDMITLMIDDDPISRDIAQKTLTSFGMSSEAMESGELAIARLKQKRFDLILLSWPMPPMDGQDIATYIRKRLDFKTPIIALSTFGKDMAETDQDQSPINGFLTKPLMPSRLFDMIMEVFGKPGLKQDQSDQASIARPSMFKNRVRGCRILVAEDNPTNQEIARAVLESAGIQVELAHNGKQAVDRVKNERFDAVLMDMQMPEMDGYEAVRKIREWEEAKSEESGIPIIAMTAHAMKGDEEKCLSAGMNGYVSKPIQQDALFKALASVIPPRRAPEEAQGFAQACQTAMSEIRKAYHALNWNDLGTVAGSLAQSAGKCGHKKIFNISKRMQKFCDDKRPIPPSFIESLASEINALS